MEQLMQYLMRPGTLAAVVLITIVSFFVKRIVETAAPSMKQIGHAMSAGPMYGSNLAMWWHSVVLPAVPVLTGGALGFVNSDFINGGIDGTFNRVMVDCGVGWFSGVLYAGVRKTIKQKTGIDIQPASTASPSSDAPPPADPPADSPADPPAKE